jgi:hypothetical protein
VVKISRSSVNFEAKSPRLRKPDSGLDGEDFSTSTMQNKESSEEIKDYKSLAAERPAKK